MKSEFIFLCVCDKFSTMTTTRHEKKFTSGRTSRKNYVDHTHKVIHIPYTDHKKEKERSCAVLLIVV